MTELNKCDLAFISVATLASGAATAMSLLSPLGVLGGIGYMGAHLVCQLIGLLFPTASKISKLSVFVFIAIANIWILSLFITSIGITFTYVASVTFFSNSFVTVLTAIFLKKYFESLVDDCRGHKPKPHIPQEGVPNPNPSPNPTPDPSPVPSPKKKRSKSIPGGISPDNSPSNSIIIEKYRHQ